MRAKRDSYFDPNGPNHYKEPPDILDGPSPSPGLGLDIRILESDDGPRHLKYRGEAADLMATTTPAYLAESHPLNMQHNVSRDDLKSLQARFNRWRLDQAGITRPRVTTPVIALILDPNYHRVDLAPAMPGSRRMMGPGNEFPTSSTPVPLMFRLDPSRILGPPVIGPFIYRPFAIPPTAPTPVTPDVDVLSPLELFKRLYVNTTKRRIRTRKPRPKTPARKLPMKDYEYISEDKEVGATTSIIQTFKPDEIDEKEDKTPDLSRFRNHVKIPDTIRDIEVDKEIILNTPRLRSEGKAPDASHAETVYQKPKDIIPNIPRFRSEGKASDAKTYDMQPEIKEVIGKIKNADLLGDEEEFEMSNIRTPILEKPEIKQVEKELLTDLVSYKAPEIPKQGLEDIGLLESEKLDSSQAPGGTFKELMQGPQMELNSGHGDGDALMNKQLKALLMPEGELYDAPKSSKLSNSSDYMEMNYPDEIKGLPIRRRRNKIL
ncbi:hypothetical protein O0L34_g6168 [Tuta absoluta]|nr:hypothetical protein O0L34_g6168 [Tuta absoluta]